MELTLAIHQITDLRFGDSTYLDGSTLVVDRESLSNHLLEDPRLQSVDMDIAIPGEACRIGVVFDIIEPRVKASGAGSDYPGIFGPIATAGQGTTHVLRGAAVTLVDEAAPLGNNKIVEMSGPASSKSWR